MIFRHPQDFNAYFLPHKMRVPFEWQRLENKELGAGSFGKVYLVMNLRDKCLMYAAAVKLLILLYVIIRNLTGP